MPFELLTLSRRVTAKECLHYESRGAVPLQVAVHANTSGKLIVICPGYGAGIDGEDPKLNERHPFRYREIAEALHLGGVAAVVRTANRHLPFFLYEEQVVNDLRSAAAHALRQAVAICGTRSPSLYLMGFSAGASAVAALATELGAERLLLLAPSGDAGPERITAGLAEYRGEIGIVVGEKDEVVTSNAATLFDELSPRTLKRAVIIVPSCDHFFSKDEHDRLFRRAPFWAFSEDPAARDLLRD